MFYRPSYVIILISSNSINMFLSGMMLIGRKMQQLACSNSVCVILLTGCKMQQLACSNSAVYSVDIAGQPYVRLGIEAKNTQGLSWLKIPGVIKKLAGNHAFCEVHRWFVCYIYETEADFHFSGKF